MSEAEKPEPKTGKRIVSKGEYVAAWKRKIYLALFGIVCLILSLFFTVLLANGVSFLWGRSGSFLPRALSIPLLALGLFLLLLQFWVGLCSMQYAKQIDPDLPLTSTNTADLPAPDSLVRASEQPLQVQQNVLLRAAIPGQQTPTEQLVRPAGGQE